MLFDEYFLYRNAFGLIQDKLICCIYYHWRWFRNIIYSFLLIYLYIKIYVKCILLINKMFYYKNAPICYSKAVTWRVRMLLLQDNFHICCYNDKVATKAVEASVLPDCCLESREISHHRKAKLVSFVSQIIHALTIWMHHMLSNELNSY